MNQKMFKQRKIVRDLALVIALGFPVASFSDDVHRDLSVQGEMASKVINALAAQTNINIILSDEVDQNIRLSGLSGDFTLVEALDRILKGTSLNYEFLSEDAVLIKEEDVAEEGSEDEVDEEIIVTGSMLLQNPGEVSRLIDRFDREEIEASGATTISDFLAGLPQNLDPPRDVDNISGSFGTGEDLYGATGVNLRGLGEGATLILLDGRRIARGGVFGEAQDISLIPLESVERIEILYDGASSIYGSDAIGGVVNIITRRDFGDTLLSLRYDTPEGGGTAETNISLSNTFGWETGRLSSSYSYRHRSRYMFSESGLPGLRRFGIDDGTYDPVTGRSTRLTGVPAYLVSQRELVYSDEVGAVRPTSVPLYYENDAGDRVQAIDGEYALNYYLRYPRLIAAPEGYDPVYLAELPGGEGSVSRSDVTSLDVLTQQVELERARSLYPTRDTHSASLTLEQELPFDIDLHTRLSYSKNKSYTVSQSNDLVITVAASHPDNIFGTKHSINIANMGELPFTEYESEGDSINFSFDLQGDISDTWRWKVGGGFSRTHNNASRHNTLDYDSLSGGVGAYNPVTFRWEITPYLNSYNVYQHQFGLSQEAYQDFILADPIDTSNTNINKSLKAEIISDSLFTLPAGDVRGLVRVGGIQQEMTSFDGGNTSSFLLQYLGLPNNGHETENDRTQNYVRAELFVPLIGETNALPGVESLSLTGSGGYDRYDAFSSEGTWSAGANWRINNQLTVKLNKSTSVKIPNLISYAFPATISPWPSSIGSYLIDGLLDEQGNVVPAPEGYQSLTGSSNRWFFGTIQGGNPDLRPERSVSESVAFEFTPDFAEGLHVGVSFYRNNFFDQIGSLFISNSNLRAEDVLEDRFPYYIRPNPTYGIPVIDGQTNRLVGLRSLIDRRSYNTGLTEKAGIDTSIRYAFSSGIGDWYFTLRHGYLGKSDKTLTTVCGMEDCDGLVDDTGLVKSQPMNQVEKVDAGIGSFPQHSLSAQVRWRKGGWMVSANTNWRSNMYRAGFGGGAGTTSENAKPIDLALEYDFDRSDSQVSSWLRGTKVQFRAVNVFLSESKIISTYTSTGFNNRQTYVRPRTFSLSLVKKLDI